MGGCHIIGVDSESDMKSTDILILRSSRFRKFAGSPEDRKINRSDPKVHWNVKMVRQLQHVLDSYRMMFRELTGKISSSHYDASAKKRKYQKNNTKTLFGQAVNYALILFLRSGLGT